MTLPIPLQVVTLFRRQEEQEGGESLYRVRVQEIKLNSLLLDVPLGPKAYPVFLPVGETIRLGYSIADRAFYTFESVVQGHGREELPHVQISRPREEEIRKVQRRNFFRVPVYVDGMLKLPNQRELSIVVRDLSGGGFSFLHPQPILKLDQETEGTFQLEQGVKVDFAACVRRVELIGEPICYLHGLHFTQLTHAHRKLIVKYCLKRQSQLLRLSP